MAPATNIGVVILAGGASTRLGRPKQLLKYNGKYLLQTTVDAATGSGASPVIVVLGANADQIAGEIDRSRIHIIKNTEWQEGIASSVRNGLNELLFVSPATEAAIFMVCDQPHVSYVLINDLIDEYGASGKPIVACRYGEAIGTPALFHRSLFDEIMRLKGDAGARKIIQQHPDEVGTVIFEKGKIDIDTPEDYTALDL